jgi:opacity protein-like surface antigen
LYGHAVADKQNLIEGFKENRYLALKTPFSYGMTTKLGYLLNPQALIYVGLGAENTQFKLISNRNGQEISYYADTHKWAFVPSVEMDFAINQHWQLGTRFSFADYHSVNFADPNHSEVSGSFGSTRTNFAVNIAYHFINL